MRVWLGRLVLLAVAAAVGFWAWQKLHPSPELVIRKQLNELAAVGSIQSNEGQLVKLAKAQKLAGFFTSDVEVTVDVPGRSSQTFTGRDEIQQAVLGARTMLSSLKIEFLDILVSVSPDRQTATAHLTATATIPGEKLPEIQELEVRLKKIDHDWLINRVNTVKTLR
jgi:ketosteroid isomerase-like protein